MDRESCLNLIRLCDSLTHMFKNMIYYNRALHHSCSIDQAILFARQSYPPSCSTFFTFLGMAHLELEVNILVIGGVAVGKSSLIKQFFYNTIDDDIKNKPMVAAHPYMKQIVLDDKQLRLNIWDISGPDYIYKITRCACLEPKGNVFIYVIDTCDGHSLKATETWMNYFRAKNSDCSELIVGNKCDCLERQDVDFKTGEAFAEEHGIQNYIEMSTTTEENVEAAFILAISQYLNVELNSKP